MNNLDRLLWYEKYGFLHYTQRLPHRKTEHVLHFRNRLNYRSDQSSVVFGKTLAECIDKAMDITYRW